jgi:hypothetical protein
MDKTKIKNYALSTMPVWGTFVGVGLIRLTSELGLLYLSDLIGIFGIGLLLFSIMPIVNAKSLSASLKILLSGIYVFVAIFVIFFVGWYSFEFFS